MLSLWDIMQTETKPSGSDLFKNNDKAVVINSIEILNFLIED